MYIGIDIGGTNIKYGLVDETGKIYQNDAMPTKLDQVGILGQLISIVEAYREQGIAIQGIGISCPGVVQKNGYLVTAGAIKSLFGVNLKEVMEEATGIRTEIENDANSAAIAEKWIGAAQECTNYVSLVLGTGVGGGIVINDAVYRGANGLAGEFGWMMIDSVKNLENIETVSINQRAAVVGGLVHQYNLANAKNQEAPLTDAREIFQREAAGETLAKEVIAQFVTDLAVGLINIAGTFDPEKIVIGGAISENEVFFERLIHTYKDLIQRHPSIAYFQALSLFPKIEKSPLNNSAGFVGAVFQVHQRIGVNDKL